LQDQVQEWLRQQVIQEAEHAHTGLMTPAMLFTDGDINSRGMN
jgi:hypothetical protein